MKKYFRKSCVALILLSFLGACSGSDETPIDQSQNEIPQLKEQVVSNYVNLVSASYEDTLQKAIQLEEAINIFVSEPSEDNFNAAKSAWRNSREPYGQTEAYRFYDGPIDAPNEGPESQINSWPLDEATIDYVQDKENAGIINDLNIEITAESLVELNTQLDEAAVTTGYHAIEFLLWGQDHNENPQDAGLRPYTDYISGGEGTAANQERRGVYLNTVANVLVSDLEYVNNAWSSEIQNNYRQNFLKLNVDEALRRIIVGIGSLSRSELSGERMEVALLKQDQEDEHSCFSDNTHRDILNNFRGIQNVYLGEYQKSDGTWIEGKGLQDLFQISAAELNSKMLEELQKAEDAIHLIDQKAKNGMAFDQQIIDVDSRENIQKAIDALVAFGDLLPDAAVTLGINLNSVETE
ncbi:MAG: iron-regulated protein [Deltaproteobacteria bacterium]|nr:iron-regulated protein [Deltaproteobacteria bacterium]